MENMLLDDIQSADIKERLNSLGNECVLNLSKLIKDFPEQNSEDIARW